MVPRSVSVRTTRVSGAGSPLDRVTRPRTSTRSGPCRVIDRVLGPATRVTSAISPGDSSPSRRSVTVTSTVAPSTRCRLVADPSSPTTALPRNCDPSLEVTSTRAPIAGAPSLPSTCTVSRAESVGLTVTSVMRPARVTVSVVAVVRPTSSTTVTRRSSAADMSSNECTVPPVTAVVAPCPVVGLAICRRLPSSTPSGASTVTRTVPLTRRADRGEARSSVAPWPSLIVAVTPVISAVPSSTGKAPR